MGLCLCMGICMCTLIFVLPIGSDSARTTGRDRRRADRVRAGSRLYRRVGPGPTPLVAPRLASQRRSGAVRYASEAQALDREERRAGQRRHGSTSEVRGGPKAYEAWVGTAARTVVGDGALTRLLAYSEHQ